MKQQNYRTKDISESLELRRCILGNIDKIESTLWTDDIDAAIRYTSDLHLSLVNLKRLQHAKVVENKFNELYKLSNAHGLKINIIKFEHKKAD